MKRIITFAAMLALGMVAVSSSYAQTYKPDWATKLVLAGGGTDVTNTITLTTASGGSSPITLTFPNAYAAGAGYVLTSTTTGGLSWSDPAAAINLNGDVTGPAGTNVVTKINGAALGSMTTIADGSLLIWDNTASLWKHQTMTGDAAIDATGAITVSKYNNGTTFGTMAHQDASSVAITGGTIDGTVIGGTTKAAASFTNLTATGTVSLPAGSVTASSLGLADGKILIGDGSNHAAAQTVGGDLSLADDGTAHVNSVQSGAGSSIASAINSSASNAINGDNIKTDATLTVSSNNLGLKLDNANSWSATQTFATATLTSGTLGATKFSANSDAGNSITANTDNWALASTAAYFYVSSDAARNVTGIANGAEGRIIVLVNNGSNAITLVNASTSSLAANRFNFAGGAGADLIMAPNAVVTLIYDNTSSTKGWRLISAQ